ncbi:MAG TPA: aryl-sulfate sulfotransferase [Bacilli bacterium]|nr:aryl-sulfate sulfotransferase [Bacilli bacterium]
MKKKKILLTIFIFIILLVISLIILNRLNTNTKLIETKKSLISLQNEYEKDFSTSNYTIENPNVILDPYKSSPLTALILFETNDNVAPKVTVKGKDKNTTLTHTFNKSKKHYLSIYGLYANYNNEVIIEYKNIKKTINIQTSKLPDDFILPTSVKADKNKLDNDFYFFTPSSKGYSCAYDVNGDVRWYLTNYALWDNSKISNGHILVSTERLINSPYYMTGLYEIDMLGKIYKEYSLPGGYHHDYYEMPNGNLLIASNDFNNEAGTVEDYIVEVDYNTGNIVKSFDLKDILNMNDGQSENWTAYDWFHNNSVWYDEKTNSITLSGRHQDAVINIDYDTGKLKWIIGDPTNWSKEYQKYFFKPVGNNFEWQYSQHAAMITKEGYVFLFDNGNNKSKIKDNYVDAKDSYSRGVMYKINTDKMTIEQIFEYGKERKSEFYSPYISDVDYLDKNHYIIHSGGIVSVDGKPSNQPAGLTKGNVKLTSDTVELLNDKVIFEIKLPTNNYRVEKMKIYDTAVSKNITAKRLGTLGKTNVDKYKLIKLKDTKLSKNIIKKYNISLTNEEDRLVFNGNFKRSDNVNIVLYNNFAYKYYNVKISKKPYTALCVDILDDNDTNETLNITKYINKQDLNGKYSIYLEINGKLYNTTKYFTVRD